MPELPEVEVVARTLSKEIEGKQISAVDVYWPRIIKYPHDQEEFKQRLIGEVIGKIRRTGKYLRIEIGNYQELVVHFRMTGKFQFMPPEQREQKHLHLFFHLSNQEEGLAYIDVRKFGDIFLVPKGEYQLIKGLFTAGVDPLTGDFSFEQFRALIRQKQRKIKALLLDQTIITGLGNYICDEVLWFEGEAGVHPERLSHSLSDEELWRIYKRIAEVIETSIGLGGNSFRDFSYADGIKGEFKNMLKVYGRLQQPCLNCQTPIEKVTVGGRTSHYCPVCQRKEGDA